MGGNDAGTIGFPAFFNRARSSAASTDALAGGYPDGMAWAGGAAFAVGLTGADGRAGEDDGGAGDAVMFVVDG
jgi:hypothetical protein